MAAVECLQLGAELRKQRGRRADVEAREVRVAEVRRLAQDPRDVLVADLPAPAEVQDREAGRAEEGDLSRRRIQRWIESTLRVSFSAISTPIYANE